MLEEALRVVEAARRLKLEREGPVTRSVLDRLSVATALDALRQAIEDFDRFTAHSAGAPAYVAKPDFATPPQLNDERFVERQVVLERAAQNVNIDPTLEAEYPPEATQEPGPAPSPSARSFIEIPAASFATAREFVDHTLDLGDMEFNDGDESVGDFLMALDAIDDKLEYLVSKVGWSPRLRNLAEAANIAKKKMVLQVGHDGVYVQVPASAWSTMSVALADAVSDRHLDITIPVPRPPRSKSMEYDDLPKPRPPSHMF